MTPIRIRSRDAFDRASQVIPGGVNSPARAFGAVGGQPLFMSRGEGPLLFDLDGNAYIDYVGSWGPLILGHAQPRVVRAVEEALRRGASFGAPTELETQLAELIIDAVPSIEMVRMVSSGTEASMSAIRLARGCTGRDIVVKFAGCYHGHVDSLLVQAGSSATTLGVPNSPGVPKGCTGDTLSLRYNDVDGLAQAFAAHGDRIAGVILEPVVGNMGLVTPRPDFLSALRRLTEKHGTLLIYDEVMTGFRLAYGGAQQLYHQTPDLTVLGKIVGGGLPLAAFGGRADVMERLAPAGDVYQAGTLSGNPLATAAGLSVLRRLRDPAVYERLEEISARLEAGLGPFGRVQRVGAMLTMFMRDEPVRRFEDAQAGDAERYGELFRHLLARGVYVAPSQYEAWFPSAAHSDADIEQTVGAVADFFR
jgi:glutamate-1-semialdehyde 2,1-aminomutase